MKPARAWTAWLAGYLIVSTCAAGPVINQFEIKDLEVEVGQWEFQSQNAHAWGQPGRRFIERQLDDIDYDDNSVVRQRHALEMEVGVLEWLRTRVGIEFEKERLDDPPAIANRNDFDSLKLEEIALEGVAVMLAREGDGVGLGLLVEYQHVLESAEPDSIVLGPIIDTAWSRWNVVLNPTFVQFFGGSPSDDKLDFAYAAHVLYDLTPTWAVGIETYGTVERLGSTGTRSDEGRLFGDHDLHRAGPSAYYRCAFGRGEEPQLLTVGIGLFFGLNDATPSHTLKWSVEFEY